MKEDYQDIDVPPWAIKLILDSDAKEFGGKGRKRPEVYEAKKGDCDNQKYYVEYPLSAYGIAVFEF